MIRSLAEYLRTLIDRDLGEGRPAGGVSSIFECVGAADLEQAWTIGEGFRDQGFSLVDRSSFAVMLRLGLDRAASLDDDFAVFRFGPGRRRAFQVVR